MGLKTYWVVTKDYPRILITLADSGAEFKKETAPQKTLKAVQGESRPFYRKSPQT